MLAMWYGTEKGYVDDREGPAMVSFLMSHFMSNHAQPNQAINSPGRIDQRHHGREGGAGGASTVLDTQLTTHVDLVCGTGYGHVGIAVVGWWVGMYVCVVW